ncbi:hypothetical protein [Paraflavitalea pollutisoli]|uniref:hypothetical protein n=1 Tax=Paraflavitalea pollutisoli TaxID=3034143 RepID=UPI0023EADD01|nr:hypothetical protein [Paraflavitalea sp. H1-2-19X]
MQSLVKILTAICFLLLLGVNFYRLTTPVKTKLADIESALCAETETEAVKHLIDEDPSFMEEYDLSHWTGDQFKPSGKISFYVHRTDNLPWQHGDDLLLPPELSTHLL